MDIWHTWSIAVNQWLQFGVKVGCMVSLLGWICDELMSSQRWTCCLSQSRSQNIIELDNDAVQVAKEGDIADAMQRFPHCYNSLTAVEISDFIVQGLTATPGFWLGCQFHCTQGRPKQFANGFCLNTIVSVVFLLPESAL